MACHGPLVFGVCRRVLQYTYDAEDAVQATFLVLARMATSIWKSEALGSWLYGVAYRIAGKASRGAARRRALEKRESERWLRSDTSPLIAPRANDSG
jgi:RNA polymerase sigma-70 factor (ECF subfamily)